jgi:putative ABC transport system permease protein
MRAQEPPVEQHVAGERARAHEETADGRRDRPHRQVQPFMGRDFLPEEGLPGAPRVVAISYALWTTRFASNPAVIGQTISLNDEPTTIVAVMPEGFRFPDGMVYGPSDLWHPIGGVLGDDLTNRDSHPGLAVIGRLKAGQDLESGTEDLASIAAQLRAEYPISNKDVGIVTRGALASIVGDVSTPLTILLAAVTLLLLIACGNVAALIMTRASVRERELAIRSALGAGRRQVLGHLLSEGVLLALLGGIGGALLAILLVQFGAGLLSGLPRMDTTQRKARQRRSRGRDPQAESRARRGDRSGRAAAGAQPDRAWPYR